MGKPYMPLMMGDWIRGTRGMKASVKGVYIGLLIHQYDEGFLPADLETLALIEPEVASVWVSLESKFPEVEPGKRQNAKCEEVRAFWSKQAANGAKGGRKPKQNPNTNPDHKPKLNPNTNHHNDLDNDLDPEEKLKRALDENTVQVLALKWSKLVDYPMEVEAFKTKVRGSPDFYRDHTVDGLRLAFNSQLRNAKRNLKPNDQEFKRTNANAIIEPASGSGFRTI